MFYLYCEKSRIKLCKTELLVSGGANINEVTFKFSSDWDNLNRIAVFCLGSVSDPVAKISVFLNDENTCIIPWEVLTFAGYTLYVGVFGTNDENKVIMPTVWANVGIVEEGTSLGGEGTPPTPDIYSGLVKNIDEINQKLTEKVDKVKGKDLSSNDYTDEDKAKVDDIQNKVDKVTGKGLSSNDYTDEDKNALDGINEWFTATVRLGGYEITPLIEGVTVRFSLNLGGGFPVDAYSLLIDDKAVSSSLPITEAFTTAPAIFDTGSVRVMLECNGRTVTSLPVLAGDRGDILLRATDKDRYITGLYADGRGLSVNNFTDKDKEKVSKIPDDAVYKNGKMVEYLSGARVNLKIGRMYYFSGNGGKVRLYDKNGNAVKSGSASVEPATDGLLLMVDVGEPCRWIGLNGKVSLLNLTDLYQAVFITCADGWYLAGENKTEIIRVYEMSGGL